MAVAFFSAKHYSMQGAVDCGLGFAAILVFGVWTWVNGLVKIGDLSSCSHGYQNQHARGILRQLSQTKSAIYRWFTHWKRWCLACCRGVKLNCYGKWSVIAGWPRKKHSRQKCELRTAGTSTTLSRSRVLICSFPWYLMLVTFAFLRFCATSTLWAVAGALNLPEQVCAFIRFESLVSSQSRWQLQTCTKLTGLLLQDLSPMIA